MESRTRAGQGDGPQVGPHDGPLRQDADGSPLVFPALGASFFLEELTPDDQAGLAAACEYLRDVFGERLKWAFSSVHGEVRPFAASSFDLISGHVAQLAPPIPLPSDPRALHGTLAMHAAHYDKFGVALHGASERNVASPLQVRFFATTRVASDNAQLRTRAMLSFCLPALIPPAELKKHLLAIAGSLRLRWASAGLTYAGWELDRYGDTRDAIYAHARRHPGFEVPQYTTWMDAFYAGLRSVQWLTLLGPAFVARVRSAGDTLAGDDLLGVEVAGDNVLFQAGDAPVAGDTNRGDLLRSYARADARLRSVACDPELHFYAPWSASTTEAWLRRFRGQGAGHPERSA
jgi:hypothetical protein